MSGTLRERAERAALIDHARRAIAQGSHSFYAASRLFDRATREKVWLLYAWCRRCDDIADNQTMGGALGEQSDLEARLAQIRALSAKALAGEPSGDPSFDAFGVVAREAGLSAALAEDVIAGFALDARGWSPRGEEDLMRYCYHVAGAVGVMMALVMGVPAEDEETLDYACDLGLAFQLANIARDIDEDAAAGRCYLPIEWLASADIPPGQHSRPEYRQALARIAAQLVERMELYAARARLGAARLSFRRRWAVLTALRIYTAIGRKVRARGANAWNARVRVQAWEKLGHAALALGDALAGRERAPEQAPRFTRRELARRPAKP